MPERATSPAAGAAAQRPTGPLAWAGQVVLYGLFALTIGVFSQWPLYHHLAPDQAVVKLSFLRVGKPVGDCRKLSEAELAKLPPNMRAPVVCPRERSPVTVQLAIDGQTVLDRVAPPSGLRRDGASAVYERIVVPAGERRVTVSMSDDVRARDTPHRLEQRVKLVPGQVLVIDFDADKGAITLQ